MLSLCFHYSEKDLDGLFGSLWQALKPPLGQGAVPQSGSSMASWRNGSCSVRADPDPGLTMWMEGLRNQEGRLFRRTYRDQVLGTHHVSVETRDMVLKTEGRFLAHFSPLTRGHQGSRLNYLAFAAAFLEGRGHMEAVEGAGCVQLVPRLPSVQTHQLEQIAYVQCLFGNF